MPSDNNEVRDQFIQIRLSKTEKRRIQALAPKHELSSLIRNALLSLAPGDAGVMTDVTTKDLETGAGGPRVSVQREPRIASSEQNSERPVGPALERVAADAEEERAWIAARARKLENRFPPSTAMRVARGEWNQRNA